jgi:phenylacetic acid degradation operon negative regulatory protein
MPKADHGPEQDDVVRCRDPSLPRQLIPDDWPGDKAWAMCRDIHQICGWKTEAYLMLRAG